MGTWISESREGLVWTCSVGRSWTRPNIRALPMSGCGSSSLRNRRNGLSCPLAWYVTPCSSSCQLSLLYSFRLIWLEILASLTSLAQCSLSFALDLHWICAEISNLVDKFCFVRLAWFFTAAYANSYLHISSHFVRILFYYWLEISASVTSSAQCTSGCTLDLYWICANRPISYLLCRILFCQPFLHRSHHNKNLPRIDEAPVASAPSRRLQPVNSFTARLGPVAENSTLAAHFQYITS